MKGEKLIQLIYIYLCCEVHEAVEVIYKNDDYKEKCKNIQMVCNLLVWVAQMRRI